MGLHSHILLTGATGLIGRNWLPALLVANPQRRVSIIVRHPERMTFSDDRISVFQGDMSSSRFGLSNTCWGALSRSVTEVIHCAADVRFGLPIGEARQVNVKGTATAIEFAQSCIALETLVYISTVYVFGRSPGTLPEASFLNTCGFINTYQQTKYEAEQLITEAARALPVVIFRLSSVIGNSQTGYVDQFNHFHQLLRLVPKNPLRVIPGIPDGQVDFISTDWAVAALSILHELHLVPGRTYNISAGAGHSLTVSELIETAFRRLGGNPPPRTRFHGRIRTLHVGNAALRQCFAQYSAAATLIFPSAPCDPSVV
jgi:Putative dehydrogenase domain of multifunctional non-ribosomal peptide synthetases and related enzymes